MIEEEAAVVRLMYRWYGLDGLSFREIARRLDALGTPTKTRKSTRWSHATVANIIRNPLYGGTLMYNRRITRKVRAKGRIESTRSVASRKSVDGRGGRRRQVVGWRAPGDWIAIPVPAIVDQPTLEAVSRRSGSTARRGPRLAAHLLSGKLICAHCHQTWQAVASHSVSGGYRYRRPAERSRSQPRCPHGCKRVKADALEDAVWLAAIRTLLGSRVWEEAWARMRIDESRIADDITSLLAQRDRLQAQEERLANLYAYGDLDEVAYRGKRSELAGQRDRLGEELQALEWRLLQAKEERVSLRRDIEA